MVRVIDYPKVIVKIYRILAIANCQKHYAQTKGMIKDPASEAG